ncbi:MAG: ParB N-terminal domain-containing protein [Butyricicoccus sp.]|nr:ParB N-terminal domain-containing protein [Butyricicoccus sp.]
MNAIVNFVTTIPIANIHPFEDNPYKVQNNEEMQFLCESIRENGVLSPLLVRKIGAAEEYEVISGHRRLYGSTQAGSDRTPDSDNGSGPQRRRYRSCGQAGHKVPRCGFRYRQRQRDVLEQCEINACTPSYSQAARLKKLFQNQQLTSLDIQQIFSEEKPNQQEVMKISTERLQAVLPQGLNAAETEDYVIKACEHYRKFQRRREQER